MMINVKKIELDELYRCYSTMSMELDGVMHYFFASEEKGYPVLAYKADDLSQKLVIFEKAGGVMSMIPHPNKQNTFLMIRDFYLKESPSVSKLVEVVYEGGVFHQRDLVSLPFLHRFDVLNIDDVCTVIVTSIAHDKKDKEDWSQPGYVYVAQYQENQPLELMRIGDAYFHNHGFMRSPSGRGCVVSSDEGVFELTLNASTRNWESHKWMSKAVGEIAVADLDEDGYPEWLTIEPFHGNAIVLYDVQSNLTKLAQYPFEIDFAHTLIAAKVNDKAVFVGGIRRVNPHLFALTHTVDGYQWIVLDEKAGPANLAYLKYKSQDIILSANHTDNHACLYILSEEFNHVSIS